MNLVLPSLRADFELMYRWEHVEGDSLSLPFKILGGNLDTPISESDLEAWSGYTSGATETKMFAGDHFYLHEPTTELLP